VTLTDAGALVALIDKNQPRNGQCRATLATLSLPLVTTWPAFTEAMYLLHQLGGWPLQRNLWQYIEDGVLQIHFSEEIEQPRMRRLMDQYSDTPMDLADASLVATAERLRLSLIFTLDSDFYVYRINDTEACVVVP
jgi:uncharacterized protein